MQAIVFDHPGGSEVLTLKKQPIPKTARGEVLIRVVASGVNRPDLIQRKGKYPPPDGVTHILGLEVSGTIIDGDKVAMAESGLKTGDKVCALLAGGGYAEYCQVPVGQCLPIPQGLTLLEAASLPETYFTVWSNVFDRGHLQPKEWLLVQGGSSGIGITAIQLAKAFGAQVIATAGSDLKCQACIDLGADAVINYKTQDFSSEVLKITKQRGVDVVLDMVAGDYIARQVACMAEDSRLLIIAVQGGIHASFNAALLQRKRITITGSTLRNRSIAFKTAIAKNLYKHVWPLFVTKKIKPVIHSVFKATEVAQAHDLMQSNAHIGKIMITWGDKYA
jgi:putative PIG3 family NAD(P)H quinone oxidoreductase